MRFSDGFLSDICDRVQISALIGQRVTWDRKKTNPQRGDFWACCPFHGEKSPSFHCEDRKGRYHCFGCGVTGGHFRFLTELDGLSFPEAVERIAGMAGVPLPTRGAQEEQRERERASLYDVMELATQFFQDRLQRSDGARARAYLRDRGLTSVTQQSFRLGYAPDSRNALKEFLASKGIEKAQIEACGLTIFEDVPVSFDRFRDRIMFPILDAHGRSIAFGGRSVSTAAPAKYLNSPETKLFHKGSVLYNFARARKALQQGGVVIVVEGYMDVIALAQAGFENTVAPLGTALTETQLKLLWCMSDEPVMCFDGDKAGLNAAYRVADMVLPLVAPDHTARFALLPEGHDPDDLVKAEGPDALCSVLKAAQPLADLVWMRETSGGVFDTPERRAELEKTLRALTSRIKDESVRFYYSQEMRNRVQDFFGSQRGYQQSSWRGGNGSFSKGDGQWRSGGSGVKAGRLAVSESLQRSAIVKHADGILPLRETCLVVSLINHPTLIDENFDHVERLDLSNTELRHVHVALIDAIAYNEANSREQIVDAIWRAGCGGIWERAVALVRKARQWTALEDAALDDARNAFAQTLHLHRSARTLHEELKQAEAELATDPTDENYRHLMEIKVQFRDVQATEALIEGFGVSSGRIGRN